MKYHIIKRCPDGRIITVERDGLEELAEHLTAMASHTPDYVVLAVVLVEESK